LNEFIKNSHRVINIFKLSIKESPQNIQVTHKKQLTRNQIVNYMWLAQRSKDYVKFMLDNKLYIMVMYNRDGTINLVSNIKSDSSFLHQLYWLDRNGYDQGRWSYFIEYWLNKYLDKNLKRL